MGRAAEEVAKEIAEETAKPRQADWVVGSLRETAEVVHQIGWHSELSRFYRPMLREIHRLSNFYKPNKSHQSYCTVL